MHRNRTVVLAVAAMMMASCAGCEWWLRITEVSGTVKVDGQPARSVRLVFEPEDRKLPRAMALTDNDGVYRLGRQGGGDKHGAAAGKYRVLVMSNGESEGATRIPVSYGTKPQFAFEVIPGEKNVFDIDVKSK